MTVASLLGASAVTLGALGAHALKEQLSAHQLESFNVAVRYQMYHVIVILIINLYHGFSERVKNVISIIFFLGILFFSGSIYLITFGIDVQYIWFLTPFGGMLFITGWLCSAYVFIRK